MHRSSTIGLLSLWNPIQIMQQITVSDNVWWTLTPYPNMERAGKEWMFWCLRAMFGGCTSLRSMLRKYNMMNMKTWTEDIIVWNFWSLIFCFFFFFFAFSYGSLDNVQEYNVTTAYRIALETWANWLESNINPLQKVFFMSMSPTHLWWVSLINLHWNGGKELIINVLFDPVRLGKLIQSLDALFGV